MTPPVSSSARARGPYLHRKAVHWPLVRPLVERGMTLERIEQRTGVRPGTVRRWADQEGVARHTRPRYPQELVAEVKRRVFAGETAYAIHKSLAGTGVTYASVLRWAKEVRDDSPSKTDYRVS